VPRLSQETLAEMVGTTRSRVSFFMNRFRKRGFINYRVGNNLHVHSSLLDVLLRDDDGIVATPSAENQTASTKKEPPPEPGETPDKDRARRPPSSAFHNVVSERDLAQEKSKGRLGPLPSSLGVGTRTRSVYEGATKSRGRSRVRLAGAPSAHPHAQ
jgi:Crp-like helix-turn-helix domain